MRVFMPTSSKSENKSLLSLTKDHQDLLYLKKLLDPRIEILVDMPQDGNYQVLVTGRPQHDYLSTSTHLHTLIIPFAGLPETTQQLMLKFPTINVHNLHFNADETAEMAIALLLAAAINIVPVDRRFRLHDWGPRYADPSSSLLLAGKTALVLGYGEIGKRIAKICRAMGMKVQVIKRTVESDLDQQDGTEMFHSRQLKELLPSANAMIIALPLTPETQNFISADHLRLMPPNAILVNVGRAKIVNEAALFEALKSGRIRAGLDVWYNYPADKKSINETSPSKFPFHELENVVMSPHRGGHSNEMLARRMSALADLLNLAAAKKPLPNKINVARGY